MFRFQLDRTMTPGSSENFCLILTQAVSFTAESNSISLIFYHRSKLTSIITVSALLWCWKSAWNISSCSHLATQVDIWVFSCSIYSSRGVVKFHFNTCKRQHLGTHSKQYLFFLTDVADWTSFNSALDSVFKAFLLSVRNEKSVVFAHLFFTWQVFFIWTAILMPLS